MWDESEGLGDTDQALGIDGSTWSTGIGEDFDAADLAAEGGALADEGAPELATTLPDEAIESPVEQPDVASLPAELTFGAQLSTAGTTTDTYGEEYAWSTESQAYVGKQTGREIDEYTGTEKK